LAHLFCTPPPPNAYLGWRLLVLKLSGFLSRAFQHWLREQACRDGTIADATAQSLLLVPLML
jgi:hypothetical protein